MRHAFTIIPVRCRDSVNRYVAVIGWELSHHFVSTRTDRSKRPVGDRGRDVGRVANCRRAEMWGPFSFVCSLATLPTSRPRSPTGRLLRSEEHTSELQSRFDLVCRLLLEK